MGREIINVSSGITVKDFITLVKTRSIPEDAWMNFRDEFTHINGVMSVYLTERDPEMGDIDLILGG